MTTSTVGKPYELLIFKILDFLALGESLGHILLPLKVMVSYKVIKTPKLTWQVGGLNPRPL